jgi:hypothetical protein
MGIDIVGFHSLLRALSVVSKFDNALTLGRQGLDINFQIANHIGKQYGIVFSNELPFTPWEEISPNKAFAEKLLKCFNFNNIDSLDYSSYENATIIHNLNKPIPYHYKKYDLIVDGGTIEHVFNLPQVFENIINLLDINGIFVSIACNNNYSGHGFYQYSPDVFASTMQSKYGMQLLSLNVAKLHTEPHEWVDVSIINNNSDGRNTFHFNSHTPVYIICIAKKISNDRASLILDPPNQFSYEEIQWTKK